MAQDAGHFIDVDSLVQTTSDGALDELITLLHHSLHKLPHREGARNFKHGASTH